MNTTVSQTILQAKIILEGMYSNQKKVCYTFTKCVFTAGHVTSQRSEITNNTIKDYQLMYFHQNLYKKKKGEDQNQPAVSGIDQGPWQQLHLRHPCFPQ